MTSEKLLYGHTFSGLEAYSILRKPFFAENLAERYSIFESFQSMPDFWPVDVYKGNWPPLTPNMTLKMTHEHLENDYHTLKFDIISSWTQKY